MLLRPSHSLFLVTDCLYLYIWIKTVLHRCTVTIKRRISCTPIFFIINTVNENRSNWYVQSQSRSSRLVPLSVTKFSSPPQHLLAAWQLYMSKCCLSVVVCQKLTKSQLSLHPDHLEDWFLYQTGVEFNLQ